MEDLLKVIRVLTTNLTLDHSRKGTLLGTKENTSSKIGKKNSRKMWKEKASIDEIAEELDVGRTTVFNYAEKLGLEKREFEVWNKGRPQVNVNLIPTKELGYVVGTLLGDGYKQTRNCVRLVVTDKEFAERFKNCLSEIGMNPSVRRVEDDKYSQGEAWDVVASSLMFRNWYDDLSMEDVESLARESKEFSIGLISGLFDSEGGVDLESNDIGLVNADLEIINLFIDIADSLGYTFHKSKQEKKKCKDLFRAYLVLGDYEYGEKRKAVKDFLRTIEPSIPRKRCKKCV